MAKPHRFVLSIKLELPTMQDQHDVASALRRVADRLNRYTSSNWGPYALAGSVQDRDGNAVGDWEVKGPHDDNDE